MRTFDPQGVVLLNASGTRCDLYRTILLCYYAESKEMNYESMNLKEIVHNSNHIEWMDL